MNQLGNGLLKKVKIYMEGCITLRIVDEEKPVDEALDNLYHINLMIPFIILSSRHIPIHFAVFHPRFL